MMTKQEYADIIYAFENGCHFPFGNGDPNKCDWGKAREHEKILRDALEKQMPKKILNDHWCRRCPTCDELLSIWYKHCPHCGQALDWGKLF